MKRVNFSIPEVELVSPGHFACQGCGAALAMRYVLKGLGEQTVVVLPACCWSVIAGGYPNSSLRVPAVHTAFETAASVASGVRAALDLQGDRETTVVAWAGDGGTFDIGLQALSGAAERNENILYVCYDNEAYMNTGIQRSSGTPFGAWTTTTPQRKTEAKKDIMQIVAAHGIPYAATATISFPDDLVRKVVKAKRLFGTRFLHVLAPCPPGWKIPSERSVEMGRLAVESRVFPLFEVEGGTEYTLNESIPSRPVEDYLSGQGRFGDLTAREIGLIQENVDRRWHRLQGLASLN